MCVVEHAQDDAYGTAVGSTSFSGSLILPRPGASDERGLQGAVR